MARSSRLPARTFARQIVSMAGYTREQAIIEIASIDGVDQAEAARRYDLALAQRHRRSDAQITLANRRRRTIAELRGRVLSLCAEAAADGLVEISDALLDDLARRWQREVNAAHVPDHEWIRDQIIEPLYRQGLIVRGLAGMRITAAGRQARQHARLSNLDSDPGGPV